MFSLLEKLFFCSATPGKFLLGNLPPGKVFYGWTKPRHMTPWKNFQLLLNTLENHKIFLKPSGNFPQNTPWKSSSTPLYGYKMEQPNDNFSSCLFEYKKHTK